MKIVESVESDLASNIIQNVQIQVSSSVSNCFSFGMYIVISNFARQTAEIVPCIVPIW